MKQTKSARLGKFVVSMGAAICLVLIGTGCSITKQHAKPAPDEAVK